ncbi:MAG TPA: hypothetical protein VKJ01_15630 [Candidatus Solibacter sp.]|nr:hypothetical protein [Candidatus Solibacter sp.]
MLAHAVSNTNTTIPSSTIDAFRTSPASRSRMEINFRRSTSPRLKVPPANRAWPARYRLPAAACVSPGFSRPMAVHAIARARASRA